MPLPLRYKIAFVVLFLSAMILWSTGINAFVHWLPPIVAATLGWSVTGFVLGWSLGTWRTLRIGREAGEIDGGRNDTSPDLFSGTLPRAEDAGRIGASRNVRQISARIN